MPVSRSPDSAHLSGPSAKNISLPKSSLAGACAHPTSTPVGLDLCPCLGWKHSPLDSHSSLFVTVAGCSIDFFPRCIVNVYIHVASPYTRVSFLGQGRDYNQFMSVQDIAWLMAYSRYHLLTQCVNKSLLLRTLERKGKLNVYIHEMCTCTETKAQVHTTETPSSSYVRGRVQSPFHTLLHFNPYLTDEEAQRD